jgi:hypothetical protein
MCVHSAFGFYEYCITFVLCLCGDQTKWCKIWETFLLWAFGKHLQKMCKITESTKFGNVIPAVYSNQWAAGTVEVPNVSSTEGACCHAVMHCST